MAKGFIEVTYLAGIKYTINIDYISFFSAVGNKTCLHLRDKDLINVNEDYDKVKELISEAVTE